VTLRIARSFAATAALLLATAAAAAPSRHALFFPPIGVTGAVPAPDDTLEITATVPYLGTPGTGRAYVVLAPGHATITNPIVAVEGFDLDNSMDWDELFTLLNREGLLDSLVGRGYDAVVLDFTDATTHIQRNAFVFTELLTQVEAQIAPSQTVAVVGASMGGLVARYGLSWLETNAIPHRVRTYVSFDTPHRGANIPLGLQHWVDFFSGQSADAAIFRDLLNTPAARQMLALHFGSTAGTTAAPDPMRAQLAADFAAVGGYPQDLRRVAFANGTGDGTGEGYAPVVGVGPGAAAASLAPRVERVLPNPSRAQSSIAFALPRAGEATVRVVAVDGRTVATLARGALAAGPHVLAWDGRDRTGSIVAAGLYFAVVETQDGRAAARIVRAR
jgi:hypothetical protein